jgi:hypothetical protein
MLHWQQIETTPRFSIPDCITHSDMANSNFEIFASFVFVKACSHMGLSSLPSVLYLIFIPWLSEPWNTSVSMAANTMLNRVGASTQLCLTPFVTWNGSDTSPSCITRAIMPSWNCWTKAVNFFWRAVFLNDVPKSGYINSVKSFGQIDEGHVENR